MVEVLRIVVNLLSLAIDIGLVYFAIRLLMIFRGGRKEKPWLYILAGVLALVTGSSLFSFVLLLNLPSFVHSLGGVASMIGGGLLLAGLRREYKSWTRVE
jgi:hypothetical protein